VNGVVLVSTPQELAGMVVRKADSMLKQLKIPVLAVVENMSYFRCPDCGMPHNIFGPSHVEELAEAVGAVQYVKLPLEPRVAQLGDAGKVGEVEMPELAPIIKSIAEEL